MYIGADMGTNAVRMVRLRLCWFIPGSRIRVPGSAPIWSHTRQARQAAAACSFGPARRQSETIL